MTLDKVVISISGLEMEIHRLINRERQKFGLMSLVHDDPLANVARGHSKDMATRIFFAHSTPEGVNPTDRAKVKGYKCRKNYGSYYTDGIAENIFKSHLYKSVTYINKIAHYNWMTQSEIATEAVCGWMASAGHRKNILTTTYDREGIGIAVYLERNEIYITQNFC